MSNSVTYARRQAILQLKKLNINLTNKKNSLIRKTLAENNFDICATIKPGKALVKWWKTFDRKNWIVTPKKKLTPTEPKNNPKLSFYNSREWLQLRYKTLTKYGRQCMCCGNKPPNCVIHVDHIKPRSLYPELELSLDNLQILCADCNLGKSNLDDTNFIPIILFLD